VHSSEAVDAGVVTERERCDHEVADLEARHLGSEILHHTDELMTDAMGLRRVGDTAVGPQVRTAHAGRHHPDDGVGGATDLGVGHVLEPDVTGAMDDGGAHRCSYWSVGMGG